jgi:thiamine-phosphate pyrophosphorylase
VAIGGITSLNARDAIAAGANGVAVVSAIFGAADPETAARQLLASMAS